MTRRIVTRPRPMTIEDLVDFTINLRIRFGVGFMQLKDATIRRSTDTSIAVVNNHGEVVAVVDSDAFVTRFENVFILEGQCND